MSYLLLSILFLLVPSYAKSAVENKDKFVLITSLYNEKNINRVKEYITCLDKNLENELIKEILVIFDNSKDNGTTILLNYLQTKPITIYFYSGRPTYTFCFDLANELFPQSKIILANGDIYFNQTLSNLVDYSLKNKFLALTRWDVKKNGSIVKMEKGVDELSQDVWIFQTPIRPFIKSDFELGTAGCDNAIVYWAHRSGFKLRNPSLTIQSCHVHLSKIRNYSQQSPYPSGERKSIRPTKLKTIKKS